MAQITDTARTAEMARDQARPELVHYAGNWRYQVIVTRQCFDLLTDRYSYDVQYCETAVRGTCARFHDETRALAAAADYMTR